MFQDQRKGWLIACIVLVVMLGVIPLQAQDDKPDFPALDDVIKDYEQVISTADNKESLFTVWVREKDDQVLAALPRGYDKKRFFIAMTVASGETYAGLQAGDMYVYWKRYDKRLALIEPNVLVRSTGDQESKDSVERLYTDRVILDVPIVAMKGSQPVIDMDALLIGQASKFFGSSVRISNTHLMSVKKAKAFPNNIELAFEVPTLGGRLQTLHYSISEIPKSTGYKPRQADTRVGYFTTYYNDFGKLDQDQTRIRYINRWMLEKADKSLNLSPPKEPIIFYIEHTTPIRYRRWIREGILYWNKAFEKVGISDAIEVYYQDSKSGAHMEKDPEDVRYNFVRWLSNNKGTAIGPSRVHPETGQILDADIILTDGWIRHFWTNFHEIMPEMMMDGMAPETLAWLAENPRWDPRVCFAPVAQRALIQEQLAQHKHDPYSGHPAARVNSELIGDDEFDGLSGRTSQLNGMCCLAQGMAMDVGMARMMHILSETDEEDKDDAAEDPNEATEDDDEAEVKESKPKKEPEPEIDGVPESFIGPLVAELVCHEVGHTLGLRHNFKASAAYSLDEINSDDFKGNKPLASSVMDYLPVNMPVEPNGTVGDYTMISVGPYDLWAIEYGYTDNERDLDKILARVAEPELNYGTDEDTYGPDPLVRRYDFSSNPQEYAQQQMDLVKYNRDRIIDKLIKDGDSWAKSRRYYDMTLSLQLRALSTMVNWLGGVHVYRDKKGDKDGRLPLEVVSAEKQRAALLFVMDNCFRDEAFGLTPELLKRMSVDKWWDDQSSVMTNPAYPIHDRVMQIQASALSAIMFPSTLRQIYDNEYITDVNEDTLTLPELLDTVTKEVWSELEQDPPQSYTARDPFISSLRRNLQQTHVELLIDLSQASIFRTAAYKPVGDLVKEQLRLIKANRVDRVLNAASNQLDPYSRAHLSDVSRLIDKTLNAQFVERQL